MRSSSRDVKQRSAPLQTARLDPTLQRIVDINPLVVQAYFNTYRLSEIKFLKMSKAPLVTSH